MAVNGYQLRLVIFATVTTALLVNATRPWGDTAARHFEEALQGVVGIGALIAAVIVARRVTGVSRSWRLCIVAAMSAWLIAEVFMRAEGASTGEPAPAPSVVAYFLPPVLSIAVMALIAIEGKGLCGLPDNPLRPTLSTTALDALVSAIAFALLVVLAGFGAPTGFVLPRSDNHTVAVAYAVAELIVVVCASATAISYRADCPYRANYLLFTGGILLLASSDRTVSYLYAVGASDQVLWGSIGFTLGPLMIGYSVLDLPARVDRGRTRDIMDWAQLVLPYVGFLGITSLLAVHALLDRPLAPIVIYGTVVMLMFVAARQIVASRAQRQLTQSLYDAQQRLAHQVHHDALTGLPNRLLFAQRLDEALADGRFVLIFVDIDDFKDVNDRFGHAAGDELLCAVGQRLRRCVGESDTLARIGGDEFAMVIDGDREAPEVVADRIRVALRDPFAVHGSSVRVRASMGLVRPGVEGPEPTPDDLLRQADISMYAGKRGGKDMAVIYRPSSGLSTDFVAALRAAKGGVPPGFALAYQPVVRLPDAEPVAVEALARWTAPNGMQIPPETFVAAAEAAGLGAAVDAMVLDLACCEVAAAGVDLTLHVNVGAARLGSLAFEEHVRQTLKRHGLPPERLVIEITETVPIVDIDVAARQIARLNAIGIRVALDDFGAGYNSLTYLHGLPVQIIKLDRGLTVGSDHDQNVSVYRSVIGLCKGLHLEVIAEGIEAPAQADAVFAAGCHLAQGHLFGRATTIAEIRRMSRGLASSGPR